jgi:hypothetical protein
VSSVHDLAGSLTVRPGAPLAQALCSGRRDWAGRLGQGRPVADLPGLLASLFNLCSHAHRLCAQLAISAVRPGAVPAPVDVAQRLRHETAQEHVRRIGLDWPRLLGAAGADAQGAALKSLQTCPLIRAAAPDGDPWPAARDWLQREWLQMPAATWLRAWQACGADWLRDWSGRHHDGWLPVLLRGARAADTAPALEMTRVLRVHDSDAGLRTLATALALRPGFALQPVWGEGSAHTGPWARLHRADDGLPLTPWALLGSRLAELVRLCLPDGPGQGGGWLRHGALCTAPGQGLAWVEMARGLLVHQVELDPAATEAPTVRACRVLAPTEWNFHPAGEVAQRVSALDTRPPAALRERQLNLLMAAFDPCVPFRVATAPDLSGEVNHA